MQSCSPDAFKGCSTATYYSGIYLIHLLSDGKANKIYPKLNPHVENYESAKEILNMNVFKSCRALSWLDGLMGATASRGST